VPLTIFWRSIFAQMALIALIGGGSLYALSQLNQLNALSAEIVARDRVFIGEAKRLMRVFLTQMRHGEKYVLLHDKAFYALFLEAKRDFEGGMKTLAALVDSPREQSLLEQIQNLQVLYAAGLTDGPPHGALTNQDRREIASGVTARVDELIGLREGAKDRRLAAAHAQAARAARLVTWMTLGGIGLAVILASIHAYSVSRPLKRLAQELRSIGRGEFQRSLDVRTPEEVGDLARAFNWMAARLAKLDEMKADFIAHVSHELRTPLTAVREGTMLLGEEIPGPLTASQREIVTVLRSHSDRLYRFLSSVLDLSKMEAGMMEYMRVPSDLLAVLHRSVQSVQLMAQRKGIHLEVDGVASLPPLLLDEGRMQQAFDNLLNNAMKFTAEGGSVRVTVAFTTREHFQDRGRWIEVRIADTGAGIPEEECERIFRRFYQSPHHRLQDHRGTGLGLAITRYIVEAHGGRIGVESQVGRGSTFFILLPVRKESIEGSTPAAVTFGPLGQIAGAGAIPWET
jgi:two-component system sensor histidine kinase GlrK